MRTETVVLVMFVFCAFVFALAGAVSQESTIRNHCDKFGAFAAGANVYDCKKRATP